VLALKVYSNYQTALARSIGPLVLCSTSICGHSPNRKGHISTNLWTSAKKIEKPLFFSGLPIRLRLFGLSGLRYFACLEIKCIGTAAQLFCRPMKF
jgi:hypothetical protein